MIRWRGRKDTGGGGRKDTGGGEGKIQVEGEKNIKINLSDFSQHC